MKTLSLLVLIGLLLGCASSTSRTKSIGSGQGAERSLQEIPDLRTVEQAVAYVLNEDALFKLTDVVGSEEFKVTLPSGRQISNWNVNGLFRRAFLPFGKEAVPALIDMLDHDYEYVRLGAAQALMQITGRYDDRYKFYESPEQRHVAVVGWAEWWRKNQHNPRLDSQPSRVYEARYWESQTIQ